MAEALGSDTAQRPSLRAESVSSPLPSRYSRVVVPVAATIDPVVARIASQIAERIGLSAEVLAVVSPGLEELDRMELEAEVAHLGMALGVHVVADDGDVPGAVLAATVARRGLLCLGTRGASAVGEALLGSVAADVIRRSRQEVLVVGPRCDHVLRGDTFLIAIDGSDGARAIVPAAVDLAGLLGLRPRLVEVLTSGMSPSERRSELARLADVARLAGAPDAGEETLLHGSRVAETLLSLSAEPRVALLALATHGLGRFERLLAGSVTLDVVRRARCPVLVARRHPG
jgi:nucleotide-binding universal stress UspA family protein